MKTYSVTVDEYSTLRWYNEDNVLHREDGPAIEDFDGSKYWFLYGNLCRKDGPAVECSRGHKRWYLNGKLHRVDGPAIELADGAKTWYLKGERMSEEGYILVPK